MRAHDRHVLLAIVCQAVTASAQAYRVVTVDPSPSMVSIRFDDINSQLTGVGSFSDGVVRPFVWGPSGATTPLGTIDVPAEACWFQCLPVRINNREEIGGVRSVADNNICAIVLPRRPSSSGI